jgi:hypothetical protein
VGDDLFSTFQCFIQIPRQFQGVGPNHENVLKLLSDYSQQ